MSTTTIRTNNTSTTGGKLSFKVEEIDLVKNVLEILKTVFPKISVKEGRENLDRNNLTEQISTALKIVENGTTNSKNNLKGGSAAIAIISPCQCQAIKNICKMFGIK